MKKTILITTIALLCISAKAEMKATYPKEFIPFWTSDGGGFETTLLNTRQIVRIVPVFDNPDEARSVEDAKHLEVYLSDGKIIEVNEGFKEFCLRVRKSQ